MPDELTAHSIAVQVAHAMGYYAAVLLLARLAGKRLAGQMTTFDLLILIALATAAQRVALTTGDERGILIFIVAVMVTHRVVAWICSRSPLIRRLIRGAPRALVRHGVAIRSALREESVTEDELLAGLRKLGYAKVEDVELAVLEETGHISAIPRNTPT